MASWFDANSIMSFSSKGFENLASKILVVIPFFLRTSEAFLHSWSLAPKFKIATCLPVKIIFPFPISRTSPMFGNSIPVPVPLGYLKADGLSLIVTEVFTILTSSASSLAAITIKFGRVVK